MKLLCVNVKDIFINGQRCYGGNKLKEGEIYTTKGKPFLHNEYNQMCYYIDGIGVRLCCRFTELLDEKEEVFLYVKEKELCLN